MSLDFDEIKRRHAQRIALRERGKTLSQDALFELQERFEVLPTQIEERRCAMSERSSVSAVSRKFDRSRLRPGPTNWWQIHVFEPIWNALRPAPTLIMFFLLASSFLVGRISGPGLGNGVRGTGGGQKSGLDYAVAELQQLTAPDPSDPKALEAAERTLERYLELHPTAAMKRVQLIQLYILRQDASADAILKAELSKKIEAQRNALPPELRGITKIPYEKR